MMRGKIARELFRAVLCTSTTVVHSDVHTQSTQAVLKVDCWLRFSSHLLWLPYGIGQTIIFSSCCFFLSSVFYLSFFFSPNVSGHTLDVYILPHMVWS